MHVIHVIVKTEETQKLRIKFVLVLHYLSSNTNKSTIPSVNRSITLSTNKIFHSICQQVDTSGHRSTSPPLDSMRTAALRSQSCLAVDNPNKDDERNSTSHLSVHDDDLCVPLVGFTSEAFFGPSQRLILLARLWSKVVRLDLVFFSILPRANQPWDPSS